MAPTISQFFAPFPVQGLPSKPIRFPENFFSPSATAAPTVGTGFALEPSPVQAKLAAIAATLDAADQNYQRRQYGAAFSGYNDASRALNLAAVNLAAWPPDQRSTYWEYIHRVYIGAADCLHGLGNWEVAETYYGAVQFFFQTNADPLAVLSDTQLAYVFLQWTTLYLDWGNALFIGEDPAGALAQFTKALNPDGSIPAATPQTLYGIPSMHASVAAAAKIAQNIAALIAQQQTAKTLDVNPILAATLLGIHQQHIKIANGLDYWGHWHSSVPIWTFDYLQGVATNFAQFAISAERDFINFQERSDQGSATRQQLAQLASQAGAEVAAAQAQAKAVAAEAVAYGTGAALAAQRAVDAQTNSLEYARESRLANQFQALQVAKSGGDSSDTDQLNQDADLLINQGYIFGGDKRPVGETMGAASLAASRLNRDYEVDSLQRTANELNTAALQARQETAAAQARVAAANAATAVAALHAEAAQQNLTAFDSQRFTPDVWQRMADTMWRLYRRYLEMALKTALMMQRAYNFETDQALSFIKKDYSTDEVKGLLGADALMADIQSFTYDLITSTIGKAQPIRQTISLSQRYAYQFEKQFRATGVMEFETRIDDFDEVYPGTYAGRIENVEVEVVGLIPPNGVSGSLTNSGISGYRTPASAAAPGSSGIKYRVQPKETLILSDYSPRNDTGLIPQDLRIDRIFQGAGLVSTWRLELPRAINDVDYGALLDVRVTFDYKARYDPDLHDRVLNELASRPGVTHRQRGLPLRWIYPDAFFHFQDTGVLAFSQKTSDFRANETAPVITSVGVSVATKPGARAQGLTLRLTLPGKVGTAAPADANGQIDSGTAGSPWTPLVGGSALGDYVLTVSAADNPSLVNAGKLDLSSIINIALVLEYSFTPKGARLPHPVVLP